jgi:hypothetical protein
MLIPLFRKMLAIAVATLDWGSGVLLMCVPFVIRVRFEVDTVLKTDNSSRAVEPEAAAVVDVLSEVETISLGGAVPFVIGV